MVFIKLSLSIKARSRAMSSPWSQAKFQAFCAFGSLDEFEMASVNSA